MICYYCLNIISWFHNSKSSGVVQDNIKLYIYIYITNHNCKMKSVTSLTCYYLYRGSPGRVCLLWMIHSVPLSHETQQCHPQVQCVCSPCSVQQHIYIHVHAESDHSVSMQLERPLSDGAGVTPSRGELPSSHFSAATVKYPLKTGNRWRHSGLWTHFFLKKIESWDWSAFWR